MVTFPPHWHLWLCSKPSSLRKPFFPQINSSPNLFSFVCVVLFSLFFLMNTCDSRISWQGIPYPITAGVYLPHPDYVECVCRSEGLISCWLLSHPCLACFPTLGGPSAHWLFCIPPLASFLHLTPPYKPFPLLQHNAEKCGRHSGVMMLGWTTGGVGKS